MVVLCGACLGRVGCIAGLGSSLSHENTFGANLIRPRQPSAFRPRRKRRVRRSPSRRSLADKRDCPRPAFIVIDGVDAGLTSAANDQTPVTLTLSSLSVGQHSAYAEFRPTGVNIASHSATIHSPAVATLSQANLANTSIENLGQSAHYLVHTTAGVAMGRFRQRRLDAGLDPVRRGHRRRFGPRGQWRWRPGGGNGAAGNGSVLAGLGGRHPATRQGLIQLAQVAQRLFTTAVSGGNLFSGDKQLAAASPGAARLRLRPALRRLPARYRFRHR